MASVMLTNNTAKKAIKVIPNIKESLIPSVLLCVTFAVLIIENMVFVVGDLGMLTFRSWDEQIWMADQFIVCFMQNGSSMCPFSLF